MDGTFPSTESYQRIEQASCLDVPSTTNALNQQTPNQEGLQQLRDGNNIE